MTSQASAKGRRAWLLKWEWDSESARPQGIPQPVVGVLRPALGVEAVTRVVTALYTAQMLEPEEMVDQLSAAGGSPRVHFAQVSQRTPGGIVRISWTGWLWCGENPRLVARQVRALRADRPPGALRTYPAAKLLYEVLAPPRLPDETEESRAYFIAQAAPFMLPPAEDSNFGIDG